MCVKKVLDVRYRNYVVIRVQISNNYRMKYTPTLLSAKFSKLKFRNNRFF